MIRNFRTAGTEATALAREGHEPIVPASTALEVRELVVDEARQPLPVAQARRRGAEGLHVVAHHLVQDLAGGLARPIDAGPGGPSIAARLNRARVTDRYQCGPTCGRSAQILRAQGYLDDGEQFRAAEPTRTAGGLRTGFRLTDVASGGDQHGAADVADGGNATSGPSSARQRTVAAARWSGNQAGRVERKSAQRTSGARQRVRNVSRKGSHSRLKSPDTGTPPALLARLLGLALHWKGVSTACAHR